MPINANSPLARAMNAPAPVRQPRKSSVPTRRVQLDAPVSCGHAGGKRTIAFGANGTRIDRCTDCVKLSDRTMRHSESWVADPEAEMRRRQLARGTRILDPFEVKNPDNF